MSETGTQTQMEHAPGSFCWIELATTDGPGAKKFYTELFGWEAQDNPMGPDIVYTRLKLNGKDVGALYQKGEQMSQVPPHWASYIRSEEHTSELQSRFGISYAVFCF